jgi:hypothetical protein
MAKRQWEEMPQMRDSEAQTEAILTLLAAVEELAKDTGTAEHLAEAFAMHRRELNAAIPARLVDACGGDELAARRVLTVLERATAHNPRSLRGLKTALLREDRPGNLERASVRFPDA